VNSVRRAAFVLALVLALAGCSSAPEGRTEVEPSCAEMIRAVADATRDQLAAITFTDAEKLRRPPDGRMRVRVLPAVVEYRMSERFDQDAYLEQMRLAVSQSGKGRPTDPDEKNPTHALTAKVQLGRGADGGKATIFLVELKTANLDRGLQTVTREFPWR
jgi:hypothetical protein